MHVASLRAGCPDHVAPAGWLAAVTWYRKTLTLAQEQVAKANRARAARDPGAPKTAAKTGPVKVDSLQELHAARNLVECFRIMHTEKRARARASAGGAPNEHAAEHAAAAASPLGVDPERAAEVAALEQRAKSLEQAFLVDFCVKVRTHMCALGGVLAKTTTLLPGEPVAAGFSPHEQTSRLSRALMPAVTTTKDRFPWLLEFAQQALDWVLGEPKVAEEVRVRCRVGLVLGWVPCGCAAEPRVRLGCCGREQLDRCARAGDFGEDVAYRNYFDLEALRPHFFAELNNLLETRDEYARGRCVATNVP